MTTKAAHLRPQSSYQSESVVLDEADLLLSGTASCPQDGPLSGPTKHRPEGFKRPGEHKFSTAPGRVRVDEGHRNSAKYLTSHSPSQTFLEGLTATVREKILSCPPLEHTGNPGIPGQRFQIRVETTFLFSCM